VGHGFLAELVLRDHPLAGRDYESAIISGAFCGFAMGATATAIANMQALTRRHGPSPKPCHRADRRRVLYRPDQPGGVDLLLVAGVYHWPTSKVETQSGKLRVPDHDISHPHGRIERAAIVARRLIFNGSSIIIWLSVGMSDEHQ